MVEIVPEFSIAGGREILGVALILLGTVLAAGSTLRWASVEEAMRQDRPIPQTRLPIVLAAGVLIVTVIVTLLMLAG